MSGYISSVGVWIYILGGCGMEVVCRYISWIASRGSGSSLISQLAAATTVHKMGFRERTTAAAPLYGVEIRQLAEPVT